MAKEDLKDAVITGIPSDEKILKEGILQTMKFYSKNLDSRVPLKYALTEKGLWTLGEKTLFFKPKAAFTAYADVKYFVLGTMEKIPYCIFFPEKGSPDNRLFFDDHEGAVKLLEGYVTKSAMIL